MGHYDLCIPQSRCRFGVDVCNEIWLACIDIGYLSHRCVDGMFVLVKHWKWLWTVNREVLMILYC